MAAFNKATLLIPTAIAVLPHSVAAQTGKGCTIDENTPGAYAKASFTVTQARNQQPPQRGQTLQKAIKLVTDNPDKAPNPLGRNYILGKALITYLSTPGQPAVVKRGSVGYASQPEESIDLLAAADSAFTAVETANPACAGETRIWRQQLPWQTLINSAVEQFNADHADSATVLANRSLVIYRGAPYAYTILGAVAQTKKDLVNAVSYRKKVIDVSGADTAYGPQRRQALLQLGVLQAGLADSAKGDQQKAYAREAATTLQTLLKEAPSDAGAGYAQTTLAHVLAITGDTAAIRASYADQLAAPARFDEGQLLAAAVAAARADQNRDAATLFEATLTQNPNSRDALYNLAATYNALARFRDMIPLARRLVALEPNSAEDYRLFAFAYQGLTKATRLLLPPPRPAAGAKKAAAKATDTLVRAMRQQNDSLVKYFDLSEKVTPAVRVQEFVHATGKTSLSGTIENRSAVAKTYTLTVEFLDKAGAVVGTAATTVPVAAKGTAKFSLQADAKGAVAYRYAKID